LQVLLLFLLVQGTFTQTFASILLRCWGKARALPIRAL
jgi:hypothetical protein